MAAKKNAGGSKARKGASAGRCWRGYEPVPGKKAYAKGSCRKKRSPG